MNNDEPNAPPQDAESGTDAEIQRTSVDVTATAALLLQESQVPAHTVPATSITQRCIGKPRAPRPLLWIAAATGGILICVGVVVTNMKAENNTSESTSNAVREATAAFSEMSATANKDQPITRDTDAFHQELVSLKLTLNGVEESVSQLRNQFEQQPKTPSAGVTHHYETVGEEVRKEVAEVRTRVAVLEDAVVSIRNALETSTAAVTQNLSKRVESAESTARRQSVPAAAVSKVPAIRRPPQGHRSSRNSKPVVAAHRPFAYSNSGTADDRFSFGSAGIGR